MSALKLIAILSMLIDHIGYIFFPGNIEFRIVGRLAFPIFAWHISQGYVHTSNQKKYMLRMLIFAGISQLPFMLAFASGIGYLNVMFTFFLSLLVLYGIEHKKHVLSLVSIFASSQIGMDYGIYGVMMVLLFYIFKEKKNQAFIVTSILTIVYSLDGWIYQNFAILGQLLALKMPYGLKLNLKISKNFEKYFFYLFYPGHLLILYLIAKG